MLLVALLSSTIAACGSSSPAAPTPTTSVAVDVFITFNATVEAITTPGVGWLYRFVYQVQETSGKSGATLVSYHIALSNGSSVDGNFNGPGVLQTPRAVPNGNISAQTTLSVLTTNPSASHVTFTLNYTDDSGRTGSVTTDADIKPK
jgi:hypothetical protein